MDPVLLARIQFAMTIGFHFIFPPITIGMSWLIFWFMNKYRTTKDLQYAIHARFWTKLFVITFAIGVATGITMEFQFGTNWAEYSRFVGDIFGAPLAAEGIFAFFLESTFMGVLVFGWKRFSSKVMWVSSLMIALGSTISAFWIIAANSWMQTPAGYEIVNGRAVLTDFMAALFNPSTIPRFLHTVDSCLVAGSFFVLGVSAWYIIKDKHVEFAQKSLKISIIVGLIASLGQLPIGHIHAVQVAETQPEKLAAFEGLYDTQTNAPLALFGIPNNETETLDAAITIPGGLSMLVGMSTDTEVNGLKDYPKDERPPVGIVFFSFHIMFILGLYFIALTGLGLLLLWKKKLYTNKLFMKLAFLSMPLPIIAIELGWIVAEVGRQPWIVYRMLRTTQAVSKVVSAPEIMFSIILFGIIYTLLGFAWLYLLRQAVNKGPDFSDPFANKSKEAVQ